MFFYFDVLFCVVDCFVDLDFVNFDVAEIFCSRSYFFFVLLIVLLI
ncbi:hypothetical protein BDCR2A_01638 [Borrelia duttonii CR2A]|uniref:Uncharacterized protein n=1 Tax=Borrelia duttonii CR2A TaxID=1432657 RepID=W6TJT1_9SPIR|nr:hypothetical protein BDCR2A_01638 [Borrelia duttonii CR2A]